MDLSQLQGYSVLLTLDHQQTNLTNKQTFQTSDLSHPHTGKKHFEGKSIQYIGSDSWYCGCNLSNPGALDGSSECVSDAISIKG